MSFSLSQAGILSSHFIAGHVHCDTSGLPARMLARVGTDNVAFLSFCKHADCLLVKPALQTSLRSLEALSSLSCVSLERVSQMCTVHFLAHASHALTGQPAALHATKRAQSLCLLAF